MAQNFDMFNEEKKLNQTETIVLYDVNKLESFPNHPFKLVEEKVEELQASYRVNGQLDPIICFTYEGKATVIAGHHRLEAHKREGNSKALCVFRNCTYDEALAMMGDTNIHRELTTGEWSKFYRMLFDNALANAKKAGKKVSIDKLYEELAEKHGANSRKVKRYIHLSNLKDEFLDMLDNKKLTEQIAEQLAFIDKGSDNKDNQEVIIEVLKQNPDAKIDIKKAQDLRERCCDPDFNEAECLAILFNQNENKPTRKNYTIKNTYLDSIFDEGISNEDIDLYIKYRLSQKVSQADIDEIKAQLDAEEPFE